MTGEHGVWCACGHHSHLHHADPSHSGNTPCGESLDGAYDQDDRPVNGCECQEFRPREIIQRSAVESVYEGDTDACMCGCSGEYTTRDDDPDEVENIIEKIEQLLDAGLVETISPEFVITSEGSRKYAVYFK